MLYVAEAIKYMNFYQNDINIFLRISQNKA